MLVNSRNVLNGVGTMKSGQ
uniref:Eukaryotic translation initiation factor 2 beta subunit n=1 Tax=Arundo donax TaxID=35708 RepID=A0A0A9E5Q3_ARUDO